MGKYIDEDDAPQDISDITSLSEFVAAADYVNETNNSDMTVYANNPNDDGIFWLPAATYLGEWIWEGATWSGQYVVGDADNSAAAAAAAATWIATYGSDWTDEEDDPNESVTFPAKNASEVEIGYWKLSGVTWDETTYDTAPTDDTAYITAGLGTYAPTDVSTATLLKGAEGPGFEGYPEESEAEAVIEGLAVTATETTDGEDTPTDSESAGKWVVNPAGYSIVQDNAGTTVMKGNYYINVPGALAWTWVGDSPEDDEEPTDDFAYPGATAPELDAADLKGSEAQTYQGYATEDAAKAAFLAVNGIDGSDEVVAAGDSQSVAEGATGKWVLGGWTVVECADAALALVPEDAFYIEVTSLSWVWEGDSYGSWTGGTAAFTTFVGYDDTSSGEWEDNGGIAWHAYVPYAEPVDYRGTDNLPIPTTSTAPDDVTVSDGTDQYGNTVAGTFTWASTWTPPTNNNNNNNNNNNQKQTTTPAPAAPAPSKAPAKVEEPAKNLYTVDARALNVRSGPGVSNSIVGRLTRGTVIEVVEFNEAGTWALLTDGTWVSAAWITKVENPETYGQITGVKFVNVNPGSRLNVRSGPGTNYPVIDRLERDRVVGVISIEGNWVRIDYSGRPAYVSAAYLRD